MNWNTICFDTETTSLKQDQLEITGLSLCDGEHNYYIPIPETSRNTIMKYFSKQFNQTKKLIAHNIVFDLRVLAKYDITFNTTKFFDTMIAHHLINENDRHGLKHLTRTILNKEVEDYDEKLNHYNKKFYSYGLEDSYNTWLLYEHFLPILKNEHFEHLFHKIEMPFQHVLLEMALEGVEIDVDLLKQQQEILQDEILNLKQKLYDNLGERYTMQMSINPNNKPELVGRINFNSTHQIIDMFNKYNLEITELTPAGNPSVGKATMKKHEKHPFVKVLQRYKDVVKLYDGFISEEGQIKSNLQKDGKVRPNFIDTGTKTGRISCSQPNLQQLPNNRDDMPVTSRDLLRAPSGYKMFSCDYSGQEVYTMAHISKDKDLIRMLLNKQDQHLTNANAVFKLGIPEELLSENHPDFKETRKKYESYRKKGKIFSFGVPYGMGAHKFSNDFQVSEEEAQEMIDNLAEKFPKLFECIEETHRAVSEEFQVRHLGGRVRHFGEDFKLVKLKNKNLSKYDDKTIRFIKETSSHRQSFNFLIQGLCADMIRAAMVNVWNRKREHPEWGLKTIMQVHDESVYIVKEDYVDEATSMVRQAFEDVTKKFVIPLKADVVIGDTYGNSK